MEYGLIKPLTFKGKRYETVTLSDYFKTRHKMVMAENSKKPEEMQMQLLVMAFCENLPKEAFDELYADDVDGIVLHVNTVMTEYAESHGIVLGKKPRKRPVIRPVDRMRVI
ncbi:MAG: phage tail assembly protein [Pseudobdellovibrionaceae bacterium]|nr:phage tail assembly protein [Pseudobdellovibrionaceae bacterium]